MNTELMMYALADAEKYWRHKRRQVINKECDLYTEDECTAKMREYRSEYKRLCTRN